MSGPHTVCAMTIPNYPVYPDSMGLPMPDRYYEEGPDAYFAWCEERQGYPVTDEQAKWLRDKVGDINAHFIPFYREPGKEPVETPEDVATHYDLVLAFIALVTDYLGHLGKLPGNMGRELAMLAATVQRWRNENWLGYIKEGFRVDVTSWPGSEALRAAVSDVYRANMRDELVLAPATLDYLHRGYYKIDPGNVQDKFLKHYERADRGITVLIQALHECAQGHQHTGAGGDFVKVPLTLDEKARLTKHVIDKFGMTREEAKIFPRNVYRHNAVTGKWEFARRMSEAEDQAYTRYIKRHPPKDGEMTSEELAAYGKGFEEWWAKQEAAS